jgi:cell division protein FtsA
MAKERIITGIDVGSFKICTVIAQTVSDKVSIIGVSSVPSRGIKKGVVVDIDDAVEAIAQSLEAAERMAGYAAGASFVVVDGSHIASLNSKGVVAVPRQDSEITVEDVARAMEAAQAISIPSSQEIIHVLPRGFIVDSQEGVKDPVGMSGIRLEVETNIIYGASAVMRNLIRCVQQVGIDVEDLVFGGLASSEAVLNDTERELGTVVADIGGGTTDVTIFLGGSPLYCSVIPIGGQNITNDLAIGLRTSLDNAEKVKLRFSQENSLRVNLPALSGVDVSPGGG